MELWLNNQRWGEHCALDGTGVHVRSPFIFGRKFKFDHYPICDSFGQLNPKLVCKIYPAKLTVRASEISACPHSPAQLFVPAHNLERGRPDLPAREILIRRLLGPKLAKPIGADC